MKKLLFIFFICFCMISLSQTKTITVNKLNLKSDSLRNEIEYIINNRNIDTVTDFVVLNFNNGGFSGKYKFATLMICDKRSIPELYDCIGYLEIDGLPILVKKTNILCDSLLSKQENVTKEIKIPEPSIITDGYAYWNFLIVNKNDVILESFIENW